MHHYIHLFILQIVCHCLKMLTMCKPRNSDKLHDKLLRPMNFDQIDESLWNDKCYHIEPEKCIDLNPNNLNLIVLQLNI